MRYVLLTAGLVAIATLAGAQDGLRSASLPERTPMNPIPAPRTDLFLAGPDTYRPSPGRPTFPIAGPIFWPSWPSQLQPPSPPPPVIVINVLPRPLDMPRPAAAPVEEPPLVYTPAPSGRPKTFYVIPGCYMGDQPPRAELIPAGCDLANVRVIPPGT